MTPSKPTTPNADPFDLKKLRELHEAATPGPWSVAPNMHCVFTDAVETGRGIAMCAMNARTPAEQKANTEIIAYVRTHLPAVLSALQSAPSGETLAEQKLSAAMELLTAERTRAETAENDRDLSAKLFRQRDAELTETLAEAVKLEEERNRLKAELKAATLGRCTCVGCTKVVNNAWRDEDGQWCLTCLAKQRGTAEAELKAVREENRELRVMLYVTSTGMRGYHDDGELQDSTGFPVIDFKRDSVEEIKAKNTQRNLTALKPTPAATEGGGQ